MTLPTTDVLTDIRGVLLDLDGTLYDANGVIPGATQAVSFMQRRGLRLRYITNNTRRPRSALVADLRHLGLKVSSEDLFTAPRAAVTWLEEHGIQKISLHLKDETAAEFDRFTKEDTAPEVVVVGDLGSGWTFDRLNTAFRQLEGSTRLLAVQKNRYWRTEEGLVLDAGPFIAALEYASGKEAVTVGKPSQSYFQAAAKALAVPSTNIVVVGDDIVADVGGAIEAGMRGVLVRTGKFKPSDLECPDPRPDMVIDSIAELPHALNF